MPPSSASSLIQTLLVQTQQHCCLPNSKVKGFPTIKQQPCPFSLVSIRRLQGGLKEVCGLRRKNCLGHVKVFPVIPALATWGPLAPRECGTQLWLCSQGRLRAGKPYLAGLEQFLSLAPEGWTSAGECTTRSLRFQGEWQLPV